MLKNVLKHCKYIEIEILKELFFLVDQKIYIYLSGKKIRHKFYVMNRLKSPNFQIGVSAFIYIDDRKFFEWRIVNYITILKNSARMPYLPSPHCSGSEKISSHPRGCLVGLGGDPLHEVVAKQPPDRHQHQAHSAVPAMVFRGVKYYHVSSLICNFIPQHVETRKDGIQSPCRQREPGWLKYAVFVSFSPFKSFKLIWRLSGKTLGTTDVVLNPGLDGLKQSRSERPIVWIKIHHSPSFQVSSKFW